jgi:pimeloyl-ACP methyl ester carboxylesterase
MRKLMKFWWLLLLIPLLLLGGFIIWAMTPLGPMPQALAAKQSDSTVTFEENQWYVYQPVDGTPDTGLIIYPGGRVDPRSYAPLARDIARRGYLAVIVPMPLNLAVFAPGRAQEVIAAYPQIENWAIAGHSLGGAMGAKFAFDNPALLDGMALWASYPASNNDLSTYDLSVSSIYGTLDSVADPEVLASSKALLPPATQWVPIEGGNHAQFGWYGDQPGDQPAAISRPAQQAQVIEATLSLLAGL